MSTSLAPLDWIVLVAYFVATMGIGFFFYRRTRTTDGFTAGNRSIPGWVCGLSIFATFLSSISYLANAGKTFVSDWNAFVFSLSVPLGTWVAVRWFLPYYRKSQHVSAYAKAGGSIRIVGPNVRKFLLHAYAVGGGWRLSCIWWHYLCR